MLSRRTLVLLDPSTWEDKNDSEVMLAYKRRRGIEGLCALCFSAGDETIHHWEAFADGISGCCIEFDRDELLALFDQIAGIRHGFVEYRRIAEIPLAVIDVNQMPFIKR